MKRSRLLCALLCCTVSVSVFNSPIARAQSGEDFVKGLLRGLVESQLEKARRKGKLPDPFRGPNGQQNLRPGQITAQMQQLRPVAASFAQESATLAALLNTDARRNYEARMHLVNALKLQGTATAVNQQTASTGNHLAVVDSFRGLNSEWVALSHQLEQCQVVGNQTRQCVKRLAKLDSQYCSILGIQPQLSNRDLIRESYSLDSHLRELVDLVRRQSYRYGSNSVLRHNLGRHHHEAVYFSEKASAGAAYEAIVQQYKTLYENWQSLQPDLQQITSHAVAEEVRHVQESHQKIHDLLGLQIGLNTNILLHLVHETNETATELFRRITLEQMLSLPDAGLVPEAADVFGGNLQNLDSVLHLIADGQADRQAIGEAWVYADEAWQLLSYYLQALPPESKVLMASISGNLQAIQHSVGIRVAFDRNSLYRSASALEETADHLVQTIAKWQTRPGTHNRNLLRMAKKLVDQCHALEQSIADRRRSATHCRQQCNAVIATWEQIRPELSKCDTNERQTLNFIVGSFTPEIISLRTLLGD